MASLAAAGCRRKEEGGSGSGGGAPVVEVKVASGGWSVAELPQRWSFRGFQEDKDLSGIAAWDATHCLMCSDELRVIQTGTIDRVSGTITAGASIPLLPGQKGKTELDAEGVAVSHADKCYYVTGSHGVGKKKGEFQQSRCHVVRVPVDAATGEAKAEGVATTTLNPWIQSDAVLGKSFRQSLQANGFNIEGLTWKEGRLWFGLRAPNEGGDAFVLEAPSADLFAKAPGATVHRFAVGPGLGVREIAAVRGGFVLILGEALSDVGSDDAFHFLFWKPGEPPVLVGEVPAPSGKAEGMLVLDDADAHIDVLVVFDGAAGGGPKAYRLTRS